MTYQERYEKTNAWGARRIAKELMLMNGENEIVSEHDEQTICDAERQDTATRRLVKPDVKPSLLPRMRTYSTRQAAKMAGNPLDHSSPMAIGWQGAALAKDRNEPR